MRILQVVHAFPPHDWAGTELSTLHLSQELRARGHQVTVFTRTGDPAAADFSLREDQMDGLPVVRVVNNFSRLSSFRLQYDNPFFDNAFLHVLDHVRPEVIHFQHVHHLSVRLLPLAVALGYPTVLTLYDFFFPCQRITLIDTERQLCPGPERGERCVSCLRDIASPEEARQRFSYMERVLRAPDLILTLSVFLAEKIRDFFPFPQDSLRAVTLGVKTVPRLARVRAPGAPLRILYVGALAPHKGAHVLIEALKGLPPAAFTASLYGVTVGEWQSYAETLRETARDLPVRFCGAYTHEHIGSILARHDVMVMPMIWEETFSILTREALMTDMPVVATRRGALLEAVREGENGLFFEPGNADDLRRCLARFIADPSLVERLRDPAPRIKTMAEYGGDIEEIYHEIRAEPHRSRSQERRRIARRQLYESLSQEQVRLYGEVHDLTVRHVQRETEKRQAEQACTCATADINELKTTLAQRESELRQKTTLLSAIYASTTWKLYRGYSALVGLFRHRPFERLKRWLSPW